MFQDASAATPVRGDGPEAESDFQYEGAVGLYQQLKDVHATAANQISTAAANIGVAVGGLAANVATQGLRKTYELIDDGRTAVVYKLEKIQECGAKGLNLMERAITGTSGFISRKLEALSNMLDGVARTVTMRRKKMISEANANGELGTQTNATPG